MADKVVNYAALGEKIRRKRLSTGQTQDIVSEKVELSESFYGHIERGGRKLSVESLVKIADYLDLSLDFLLMESKSGDKDEKLMAELDNIFRDKAPAQVEYLLSIIKVLAENIEALKP